MKARRRSAWAAACAASAMGILACGNEPSPHVSREIARREALAHELIVDAGASRAWAVSSKSDVRFEEGFDVIAYDPPFQFSGHAFRWMGQNAHVRLKSHGGHAMRLQVHGWTDPNVIKSRPVVSAYIDGRLFGTALALEDGLWGIDFVVPADMLQSSWVDLKITISTIAFHWADPPDLKVAMLNGLTWSEIGAP